MRVVIDTNVIVSAIQQDDSLSRHLLRLVFLGHLTPLISNPLFLEYEAVTQRPEIMKNCHFSPVEAEQFLDALFSVAQWIEVYFAWRPNLADEGDNFLIELAVAGNADCIISKNIKDLKRGELLFPHIKIYSPQEFIAYWESQ